MTDTSATGPVLSTPHPAEPTPPNAAELPTPVPVRAASVAALVVAAVLVAVVLVLTSSGAQPAPLTPSAADVAPPAVALLVAAGVLLGARARSPRTWFPRRRVRPALLS
ncbi:hypothetical protein [Actinokineospora globicatena]|uniref:Uncharacterized protein n=1 Tax=Actinokineospora globicatena TaxID=103729 RepID=A0A9W6V9A3_9PSEU|nr:hypothetical protein [Actinokineospora globicatena]GLW94895.1 hypothetical protein Aglo03_57110 [Actinokineospora globicatena]